MFLTMMVDDLRSSLSFLSGLYGFKVLLLFASTNLVIICLFSSVFKNLKIVTDLEEIAFDLLWI